MPRFLQVLWLLLPVYAANMVPPFARFFPRLARPISERWLGSHKTWLGYVFAVIAASVVAAVQLPAGPACRLGADPPWYLFGPACGLGAMLGDSAKSFVKRRLGIAPGERWVPADQIDFALGGLVAVSCWVPLAWADWALVLAVTFFGALVVNRIAFAVGIKDTPW